MNKRFFLKKLTKIYKNKFNFFIVLFFSIISSICYVVGEKMNPIAGVYNKLVLNDIIYFFLIFSIIFVCVSCALMFVLKDNCSDSDKKYFSFKRFFWIAILMLVCWSPYFLTFFHSHIHCSHLLFLLA